MLFSQKMSHNSQSADPGSPIASTSCDLHPRTSTPKKRVLIRNSLVENEIENQLLENDSEKQQLGSDDDERERERERE